MEKGTTTEDEMGGWHHQLDGQEFEHTPGVGGGQGSLLFCSPWGRKMGVGVWWIGWESSGDWQSVAVALRDQKVLKALALKTHL